MYDHWITQLIRDEWQKNTVVKWDFGEFTGMLAFAFPICSTRTLLVSRFDARSIAFGRFAIRIFPLLHSVCAISTSSALSLSLRFAKVSRKNLQ